MFGRNKDKEKEVEEEEKVPTLEELMQTIQVPEDEPLDPEATYSMEEVTRRWKCSQAQIKREMEVGLPMYQNRNGKWRIKGEDILIWEKNVTEQKANQEREKKRTSRGNVIAYVIGGIIIAIFGFGALYMFTNV